MAKNNNNNYNRTELIWDGKFEESVKLPPKRAVERIVLPFQTIEVINEPREGTGSSQLFSGRKKEGWRNKLIWGDNKLIMSSLLKEFAGKINLIYIDPPFDVGADFSIQVKIGDEQIIKEPSILEEKAYRDTWGKNTDSYLQMLYQRLKLMGELLDESGAIYVHLGTNISHYVKVMLDEIFAGSYRNEIAVRRVRKNIREREEVKSLNVGYDVILFYTKSFLHFLKPPLIEAQREERWHSFEAAGVRKGMDYKLFNFKPRQGNHWRWTKERANEAIRKGILRPNPRTGKPEYFIEASDTELKDSMWDDLIAYSFQTGYDTEKSEKLLERIIEMSSKNNDLIADFFCGSGTTGAVAERLGRRWIMCDLGRFAIHTSRKRLMEVQRKLKEDGKEYHPFEILNLGKYERQHWQAAVVSGGKVTAEGKKIAQYVKFIIELYRGEMVNGFKHLHGKKEGAFIHIGAVDAPVTMNEIKEAVEECKKNKFSHLDILGWEWEMGVNEEAIKWAKSQGVRLRLLQIPREVMDRRATESGEVKFFELDYVKVDVEKKDQDAKVTLKNFAIPSEEFIPNELRGKIKNWSDYIDYWSVDWDYASKKDEDGNYIFENDWQTFRTKKNPRLELETPRHKYTKKGKYLVLVKVIDIFGNDTSKVAEVKV